MMNESIDNDCMKPTSFFATLMASLGLAAGGCAADTSMSTNAVHHVQAQAAQNLIKEKQATILDIRTPAEFNAGHIAGATNINFMSSRFEKELRGLDKEKTYLLHCASGNRSSRSLSLFQKLGFKNIYHLDGGIKAWERARLPLEK
jgi:phage shock protein E